MKIEYEHYGSIMSVYSLWFQEEDGWLVVNNGNAVSRNKVLPDEPHSPLAHLEDTLEGESYSSGAYASKCR